MIRELPFSEQAERDVIGSVMAEPETFQALRDALMGDDFFLPAHRVTWDAFEALAQRQEPTGALQVIDELRAGGHLGKFPEGAVTLSALAGSAPWSALLAGSVRMVSEKAALRRIIVACSEAVARATTSAGDASGEIADELGAALVKLRMRNASELVPVGKHIDGFLEELGQRGAAREIRGVSSGIAKLDSYTGGFLPGQLVVVAARPGQGKTAFALNICRRLVLEGGAALFLSLEMTTAELIERLMVQETQFDSVWVRQGRGIEQGHWQTFFSAQRRLEDAKLYICDDVQTSAQIASVARRFRARHPGQNVIIALDYLQLVKMNQRQGVSRSEQVAEVSADMKRMAKALAAPVLELSQLNRSSEHETRAPRLSDLRDSGAIEQDADIVLFPYNADKIASGDIEVVLGKNRNGASGTVAAHWNGPTYMFSDADGTRPAPEQREDWRDR
jgi:replicative DNA helicase